MSNGDSSQTGDQANLDITAVKQALASSSTNVRITQLRSIEEKLTQKCAQVPVAHQGLSAN